MCRSLRRRCGTLVAGIGFVLFLGLGDGLRLSCVFGAVAGAAVGAMSADRGIKDVYILAGLAALFLGPGVTYAVILTAFSLMCGAP
jgi:hypothetical protein